MDEDLLIKYGAGKTSEYQYWVLDTGIKFSEPINKQWVPSYIFGFRPVFFLQKLYSQFRIVSFNSDDRASQQGHSEGLTPIYSKSCIKNITNGS